MKVVNHVIKLKKDEKNPLVKPRKDLSWAAKALFNCAAVYKDGLIYLLPRAIGEYEDYVSRVALTTSVDGVKFDEDLSIFLEPQKMYERFACEDPRITPIEDKFLITYVGHTHKVRGGGGSIARTALASTKDFKTFKKHGIITPKGSENRDVVIFPEKINGKYVMLHRPHNWTKKDVFEKDEKLYLRVKEKIIKWPLKEVPSYFPEKPSIWIAYSDNLKDWYDYKVVMEPTEDWESLKIGAGPPPIKTGKGWLVIYHGVSKISPNSKFRRFDGKIQESVYKAGAALLDLDDILRVIGRTKNPILEPEMDYEIFGDVPNVVFPEGVVVLNNKLHVYYGAADKTCCLATCNLDDLIMHLLHS